MTLFGRLSFPRGSQKYQVIVEALERAVRDGALAPGQRLPTHRELAKQVGVTVGTVTRAYEEAGRRGLVQGTVGRGTFVLARDSTTAEAAVHVRRGDIEFDLGVNYPALPDDLAETKIIKQTLADIASEWDLASLFRHQPHAGLVRHREAGALLLERSGLGVSPDTVAICAGTQHALSVILTATCKPGDTVLTEELTYPGLRSLAAERGLRLHGVSMDNEGLHPGALEAAIRSTRANVLYTVPTVQNPTTATMSETRRQAIADIARRHDLRIIEDNVYGMLVFPAQPPLALFAPERTFHILSASKIMAAGLRIAWLYVPQHEIPRVQAAIRTSIWMAPPLMAEIAGRWVVDGTADTLLAMKRKEAVARQALAREVLRGKRVQANQYGYHLWLDLPPRWHGDDFAEQALNRGVAVTPASAFYIGSGSPTAGVRISLHSIRETDQLTRGLERLRALLDGEERQSWVAL